MGGEFVFSSYDNKFSLDLYHELVNEVKRIESKFTEFHQSELTLMNKKAARDWCDVDREMIELLNRARHTSDKTMGRFDVTFATLAMKKRELEAQGKSLGVFQNIYLSHQINYKNILIDENKMKVKYKRANLRVSLGGIGKGYAVDRCYDILKGAKLSNFFINGSGDIRVYSEEAAPRTWRIGIQNPFSKEQKFVGTIQLGNGAVATSGSYKKYNFESNDKSDHHIIAKRSGRSLDEIVSVTVLAKDCVDADTYATAIMSMKLNEAKLFIKKNDLFSCMIDKSGKTYLSDRALHAFSF